MIDSILNGLKDQIPGDLLSKVGLDPSKSGDIAKIAGESAKEVMGKELLSGGIGTVMNLFSNNDNNTSANALQSSLTDNLVGKLASKLGLSPSMANTLAQSIVPMILNLVTKKNSETPDTDFSAITDMFGGGGGIMDKAKGMLGGLFK